MEITPNYVIPIFTMFTSNYLKVWVDNKFIDLYTTINNKCMFWKYVNNILKIYVYVTGNLRNPSIRELPRQFKESLNWLRKPVNSRIA